MNTARALRSKPVGLFVIPPPSPWKVQWARVKKLARRAWCVARNGDHELYRAHTDTKLMQRCLLCGYETAGWTIDRRDRRQFRFRS